MVLIGPHEIDKSDIFCQYVENTGSKSLIGVFDLPAKDKQQRILDAALAQFTQYGIQRTSMHDIAQKAEVSRASLYSYFKNKDEIFRSVSIGVHERLLVDVEAVLSGGDGADLGERVFQALFIRHSRFLTLVLDSSHGSELEDEYSRLCGDVVANANAKFEARLAGVFDALLSSDSKHLGSGSLSPADAARILNLAAAGCKRGVKDAKEFEQRIRSLVGIYITGLRAT